MAWTWSGIPSLKRGRKKKAFAFTWSYGLEALAKLIHLEMNVSEACVGSYLVDWLSCSLL
jgi:hypothetical protein